MCHTYTQWTEEKKKLMAYGSQFQGIRKNAKNEKLYSNNDSAGCNNQEIEANRNNMSHVLSVHTDTNRSLLTINGVLFVFYPKKIQYVYWRQCYCSDMFLLCSWRVEKNRSILCVCIYACRWRTMQVQTKKNWIEKENKKQLFQLNE